MYKIYYEMMLWYGEEIGEDGDKGEVGAGASASNTVRFLQPPPRHCLFHSPSPHLPSFL